MLLWLSSFSIANNLFLSVILILAPLMFSGPVIGAAVKMSREFAREQPVFLWTDFRDTIKSDWKQTLCISILDYFALSCVSAALPFYYYSDFGFFTYVLFAVCFVIALIILFMQYYIYMMSVSFDLSLSAVIKNSFVLSTLCIGRNLIATLVTVLLMVISSVLLWEGLIWSEYLWIALTVLLFGFLFGFWFFTVSYLVFPALQKHIIDPYYAEHPQFTSSGVNSADTAEEEKPEYVYHNGRMVHRSVLEQEVIFSDTLSSPSKQPDSDKKD